MKKLLIPAVAFTFLFAGASNVNAHELWDVSGNWVFDYYYGGSNLHDMTLVQAVDGSLTGTGGAFSGSLPYAYPWTITDGLVSENTITFTADYDNLACLFTVVGTIASDGTMSGTWTDDCSGARAGTWQTTSGTANHENHGEIVEPEEDEIVVGVTDLVAWYHDESPGTNDDAVQWAVREGTCAAGVGTVFGNVDGHSDTYSWDGTDFSASWDSTGATPGKYCFIFNPTDDAGQNNVRLTQEFWVASGYVHGGGQIIEETGAKQKDWFKVSFGGWVADIGDLVGEVQINFHNVGDNEFDSGKFHSTEIVSLTIASGNPSCDAAMNFVAQGSYNGEEGWSVVVRASDNEDTFRVQLFDGLINSPLLAGHVYDTHAEGEFTDNSDCYGTARTELDNGNITIVDNS